MLIREEMERDGSGIHALHSEAFPTRAEARLVDALRCSAELRVSLVAEEDGEIVGHVAFSPVRVEGSSGGIGLAPVAVRLDHRCRGIAAKLIRSGLERCTSDSHGFVVVLGDPSYYARFGFRPARDWSLSDEYGGGDAFQALELRPGAIPTAGGLVRYAEEFASLNAEEQC